MVHHVRFAADPSEHVVQLRRLFFNSAGWPVVSPQPFAGREAEMLPAPEPVAGTWQVLRYDPDSTSMVTAAAAEIATGVSMVSDGTPVPARLRMAGAEDGSGEAVDVDALVFGSWDWARSRPALSFSGIDQHGVAWAGTRGGVS